MPASILLNEIEEQPMVIQALLNKETQHVAELAASLRGSFQYLMIAARGTSDNAARYAQYLFGAHNRLPVALATPSLYTLYHEAPDLNGALVIGISQSGQSPDIVSVVTEARRQGRPTLAIVNDPTSPLALAAEHTILLNAGSEKATAATKTYTSSLAALALLSVSLEASSDHQSQLLRVPGWVEQTMQGLSESLTHTERYRYMEQCTVIGRGYNYSSAFEIALKIRELTGILTEPYSSADFLHGPIAVVHRGYPVIIVSPSGHAYQNLEEIVAELHQRGSELLVISDQQALLDKAQLAFPLPSGIPEWLSPLITVLPGQLFAYHLTTLMGLNPDQPIGLTKITETV